MVQISPKASAGLEKLRQRLQGLWIVLAALYGAFGEIKACN